jgi:hypothetical protein
MKRYATVVLLAFLIALPRIAHAQRPTPPPVPPEIEVPPGYRPFLAGHAVGTQGYVCVAVGAKFRWAAFGPQATLFNDDGKQQLTHFLNPTPYSLLPNPTWLHSRDSSAVWGQLVASSSDPNYVAADAIPWLLLEAVVVGEGPTGGNALMVTRYIQRLNTIGGIAPSTGCAAAADIAQRALVPYEADYFFFKERARDGRDDRD